MGFSKHYNRTFSEYWIINHIKPPKGKKMALSHNGAYWYYSSNLGLPMGFTQDPNIFLFSVDIYDCAVLHNNDIYCPQDQMDPLRMSLHSNNPYSTGWRCGEVTQENYKIGNEPYFQFLEDHVLE